MSPAAEHDAVDLGMPGAQLFDGGAVGDIGAPEAEAALAAVDPDRVRCAEGFCTKFGDTIGAAAVDATASQV